MEKRGSIAVLLVVALVALAALVALFLQVRSPTGQINGPLREFRTDEKQLCFARCFERLDACNQRAQQELMDCRLAGRPEGECKGIAFGATTQCTKESRDCRNACFAAPWNPAYVR